MADRTPTPSTDLEAQAREWIARKDDLCKWRNQLMEQGGPLLSLKQEVIHPDLQPEPLRSEIERLLALQPKVPSLYSVADRIAAFDSEIAKLEKPAA